MQKLQNGEKKILTELNLTDLASTQPNIVVMPNLSRAIATARFK